MNYITVCLSKHYAFQPDQGKVMDKDQIVLRNQEKPHHTEFDMSNEGTMNFKESHQKILYFVLSKRKERQDAVCNDAV